MADRARLPWHRRLEAHVGLGVALFVAASLVAVLVATKRVVNARSLERASGDLVAARSAFSRLADDRAEFAAAQAALVTALPIFRAHMTDTRLASDAATVEAMIEGYRVDLKADFVVFTDRAGQWATGFPRTPASAVPAPLLDGIGAALAGHPARNTLPINDRVFLVVSEPARFAEEVLGALTVGYALDDAVARRLADITHCEINLVANGHLYASSLDTHNRAALQAVAADGISLHEGVSPVLQSVGTGSYAVGAFPLTDGPDHPGSVRLVLLQDWRPTQQFVDEIRRRLLEAGAVIFAVALGGGLVFSRRMSRPLQDLAAASEDIAGGNWARQVPVHGSAEAMMMAEAFNQMTTSLRHWYEMARQRDDQDRQAQKMEAIGRLAGGIAHDFNNVLMAVKGYGQLLMEGLDSHDPRRADVDEILRAADRAAGLTRQLLAFARRQIVKPRILALDQIVEGTKPMLQRLIGEDIEVVTVVTSPLGAVRADAQQMDQVLINLAVNARDAMPDGGTVRIELANEQLSESGGRHSSIPPGRYVRLSVSDNGCGMSQETLSVIFEPFFTTKAEGKGTGLGLATVYAIVQNAGGVIDVESEVNRGTSFHVYLPQISEAEEPQDGAGRPEQAGVSRGSETILVVEDDRAVGSLIGNGLRKAGYSVLEAANGAQALEMVRTHTDPIHLLITDVVMPGMNGRALSEHVSTLRPGTRVLFMSGYSDDAMLRHGVETARVRFIHKPFSTEELTARIREAMREVDSRESRVDSRESSIE